MQPIIRTILTAALLTGAPAIIDMTVTHALAADRPLCGLGTGKPATGTPILVGAVTGRTGPGDFSSAVAGARAYFDCVNANGGINGRPIEYLIENDKWSPETASQVATKLVKDKGVVALVGNASFVEMTANAPLYKKEGVLVVAAACAARECFETSNIASTNEGPMPSNLGALQYAVKKFHIKNVACIAFNIPSNGVYSCDATVAWMKEHGLDGSSVLIDPANADFTSVILEAISHNPDSILISLPAPAALAAFKVAEEQDLRDKYVWLTPTTIYDRAVPAALGQYWSGKIHTQIEATPYDGTGPDAVRWRAVMAKYARSDAAAEAHLDTFSQLGFLAANIFVDTAMKLDPAKIDRAAMTQALRAVKNYRSDLVCGPYYFGPGDQHLANHAGMIVTPTVDGFKIEEGCFDVDSRLLDPIYALEKQLHLTE